MKWALLAAALITLPAAAAAIYGAVTNNWYLVAAAAVSLGINALPFVAAGFLIRGRAAEEMGEH